MADKVDAKIYADIKKHAEYIADNIGQRNEDYKSYERMYLLKWDDKPAGNDLKVTISPDARNAVQGAVRLMMGTDAQFNINDKIDNKEIFSKLQSCHNPFSESKPYN